MLQDLLHAVHCHVITAQDSSHVRRCVSMLAQLYHAEEACGTATVGSSEAILLGGLAMKRRWQARARERPPLAGAGHVCSCEAILLAA